MSVGAKGHALLVLRTVHHERTSHSDQFPDQIPQLVANAGGKPPDEDPGSDLQQPSCEVAAQTSRAGAEHEHDHQRSPTWP